MKILFVSPTVNLNGGGISSYAQDFVQAFKNDFDIVVVSGDDLLDGVITKKQYRKIALNNLNRLNALLLLDLIKEELPDIIVNSDSALLAVIAKFIPSEIKIVSVSHFVNGLLADIAGFNGKYINSVISLSTYGKEYLSKWVQKDRIAVIPNFYESIDDRKDITKINNEIPVIVYPGGCALHKNPFLILKLVYKLLNTDLSFKFYWLGNDTLPLAFSFKKKKVSENIKPDDRIVFTGRVTRNAAVRIINMANIFLLPSVGEGFPISLLEAMSSGTIPIISDAKHGSLDIIKDKYNGFIVSSKNVSEILEIVKDIILNPGRYIDIYANSLDMIDKEYSCHIWKQKMKNVMLDDYYIKRDKPFSHWRYQKQKQLFKYFFFKNRLSMMLRSLQLCLKFHLFFKGIII